MSDLIRHGDLSPNNTLLLDNLLGLPPTPWENGGDGDDVVKVLDEQETNDASNYNQEHLISHLSFLLERTLYLTLDSRNSLLEY